MVRSQARRIASALADDASTEYFVRAQDFFLLEQVHAGELPEEWLLPLPVQGYDPPAVALSWKRGRFVSAGLSPPA